jgi:hypothetical protein
MARPLNEFGGWLKFFYITMWIGLVALPIYMLLLLPGLFGGARGAVYWLVILIDDAICVFLGYKIIRAIKKREADTPNRLIRLLAFVLLVGVIFAVPEIYFGRIVRGMEGVWEVVKAVIKVIIWFFVWTTYFRKSKRILAYYGKNADNIF